MDFALVLLCFWPLSAAYAASSPVPVPANNVSALRALLTQTGSIHVRLDGDHLYELGGEELIASGDVVIDEESTMFSSL